MAARLRLPPGGPPGYSFVWTGGGCTKSGPGHRGPLRAGDVCKVVVTDGNGCRSHRGRLWSKSLRPLELTLSAVPVGCNGSDGAALGSVTGGSSPYDWTWLDGDQTVVSAVDSATGLSPGEYTAVVTDGAGCEASEVVTVGTLPPLEIDLSLGEVDCATGEATIDAAVSGGELPVALVLTGEGGPLEFSSGTVLPFGAYTVGCY